MRKFILLSCACVMALGFLSCKKDTTPKLWEKAEIEEIAKAAATSVYCDMANPTFINVEEAAICQDTYIDGKSVDSIFSSLPPSTLKRVADVCINKAGFTDKKSIVSEYVKNKDVYSNMSKEDPSVKYDKHATDSGGSGVTKKEGVFETSYNYYTDTIGGAAVKVQVKTEKSYVKQ